MCVRGRCLKGKREDVHLWHSWSPVLPCASGDVPLEVCSFSEWQNYFLGCHFCPFFLVNLDKFKGANSR